MCSVEDDSGLYAIGVSNPITLMKRWLVASASTSTPPSADRSPEKRRYVHILMYTCCIICPCMFMYATLYIFLSCT